MLVCMPHSVGVYTLKPYPFSLFQLCQSRFYQSMLSYTVRPLMFLSDKAFVTRPTPEPRLLHSASTHSTCTSDITLVAGRPLLPMVGGWPVFLYLTQRRLTWRVLIFMLSAIVEFGVPFFSRMMYLILSSSSLTCIVLLGLYSLMKSHNVRLIRGGHNFVTIQPADHMPLAYLRERRGAHDARLSPAAFFTHPTDQNNGRAVAAWLSHEQI